MKGFKWQYWIILILLLIGITAVFRSGVFSEDKAYSETSKDRLNVKTVTASYTNRTPKLMLNGSIEAQTAAAVSAKIGGTVKGVLAEEGQFVKAGQALIELESAELANSARMAQESVRKAQVSYNLAKTDYQRYLTLYKQDAVAKGDLDSAKAKLEIAQADLASAIASQNNAQQQYAYGVMTAPVSGVVANKSVTVGQVVSPGVTLLSVQSISQVYAVVNIEQGDLGQVKIGQKAEVSVDAYPDKTFIGTVQIVNPEAASSNRMFRTKIVIDNKDGLLKPGMFTQVQLETGSAVKVLTVPQEAVIETKGLYYAFIVKNNKAVCRPVQIGAIENNTIEIKAGLQSGDNVIVTSVNQLKDGDAVRVVD